MNKYTEKHIVQHFEVFKNLKKSEKDLPQLIRTIDHKESKTKKKKTVFTLS